MEFQTEAQKNTYNRIVPWIKEMVGELAHIHPEVPLIGIKMGTAITWVSVNPWGDDDATITARSFVVTGAELTPDLMKFLLRANDTMRFGAFGVDGENDIFFEQTVVGSTCDREDLKATFMSVLTTADDYDDKIVSRWGGSTALDKMRK